MNDLLSKVERILILGWTQIGTGRICRGDLRKQDKFCSLGWVMELSDDDQQLELLCVRYLAQSMTGEPASDNSSHNRCRIIKFNDSHTDADIAHAWYVAIDAVKRDLNENTKETHNPNGHLVGSSGATPKVVVEAGGNTDGDRRWSLPGSEYGRITRH